MFFPSAREYAALFGLDRERLRLARPELLSCTPGRSTAGVEIAPRSPTAARSLILDQVTNGVAVRMAVLYLLSGAHRGGDRGRRRAGGRVSAGRRLLIRGGRVIDPASGRDAVADVLVVDGAVAAVGPDAAAGGGDCEVIDAAGLWVLPGLIDLHVHLREPGYEYKETVAHRLPRRRGRRLHGRRLHAEHRPAQRQRRRDARRSCDKADEAALVRVYPIGVHHRRPAGPAHGRVRGPGRGRLPRRLRRRRTR